MLKGIYPLIIPEVLSIVAKMGYGDEIVLANAYLSGETFDALIVRYN